MGEDRSPIERAANITVPVLIMDGGATEWSFMRYSGGACERYPMPAPHPGGQTHEVDPEVLAPR